MKHGGLEEKRNSTRPHQRGVRYQGELDWPTGFTIVLLMKQPWIFLILHPAYLAGTS